MKIERNYYDAQLLELADSGAVYAWQGSEMRLPRPSSAASWTEKYVGQIGVLIVNSQSGPAGYFRPYMEQRLRRVPECDQPPNLWAWSLEGKDLRYVKAGIIPGVAGEVIPDETEPVTIEVPPEFFDLCSEYKMTAEGVLRGFIADACELMNYVNEPREDGYSSNGSDERTMAQTYIDRAYAPLGGKSKS